MRRNLLLTLVGATVAAVALTGAYVVVNDTADDERPTGTTMPPLAKLPGPNQAFYIQSVSDPEGFVLSVSVGGKIGGFGSDVSPGERELFVLTRNKGKFQIKTAHARVNGAQTCLTARGGRVFTNPCNPADWAQIVQLTPPGSPTFDLIVGGNNVEVAADGMVSAVERNGRASTTRFAFADGGPAPQD